MNQLVSALEIASILSLVTLAAVITFRLAGFPDLSVDGVFTLGGIAFVKLALIGLPFAFCIIGAIVVGGLAGFITSTIATRLRINPLLASVLVLTILYSLNLRILGTPNQPLFNVPWWKPYPRGITLSILAIGASSIIGAAYWFFSTEFGSALRSTGSSPAFLRSVGKNVEAYRVFLVALAGSLVSLAGSLLAAIYGFADVSLGTGTVIIGIASIIIGESICGRASLYRQICAVPIGIISYESAVGIALSVGISPTDVKLATGVIAITLLAFSARADGEALLA